MFTTHRMAIVSKKKPQEILASLEKHITSDKSKPGFFLGDVSGFSFYIYRRDEVYGRDYSCARINGTISEYGEGSLIEIIICPRLFYIFAFLVFFIFIAFCSLIAGRVITGFFIIFAIVIALTGYSYLTEVKQVKDFLKKIF